MGFRKKRAGKIVKKWEKSFSEEGVLNERTRRSKGGEVDYCLVERKKGFLFWLATVGSGLR